jgi:hypothetical protein
LSAITCDNGRSKHEDAVSHNMLMNCAVPARHVQLLSAVLRLSAIPRGINHNSSSNNTCNINCAL